MRRKFWITTATALLSLHCGDPPRANDHDFIADNALEGQTEPVPNGGVLSVGYRDGDEEKKGLGVAVSANVIVTVRHVVEKMTASDSNTIGYGDNLGTRTYVRRIRAVEKKADNVAPLTLWDKLERLSCSSSKSELTDELAVIFVPKPLPLAEKDFFLPGILPSGETVKSIGWLRNPPPPKKAYSVKNLGMSLAQTPVLLQQVPDAFFLSDVESNAGDSGGPYVLASNPLHFVGLIAAGSADSELPYLFKINNELLIRSWAHRFSQEDVNWIQEQVVCAKGKEGKTLCQCLSVEEQRQLFYCLQLRVGINARETKRARDLPPRTTFALR